MRQKCDEMCLLTTEDSISQTAGNKLFQSHPVVDPPNQFLTLVLQVMIYEQLRLKYRIKLFSYYKVVYINWLFICAGEQHFLKDCMCAQRRFRSAFASAKSDQSLRCPLEDVLDPCRKCCGLALSHCTTEPRIRLVRPEKPQISLRIRSVCADLLRKHAYSNILNFLPLKTDLDKKKKKTLIFFHIWAQNIDCGNSLETTIYVFEQK